MKTLLRESFRSARVRVDLVVVLALFGVTALVLGFVELADGVSEGEGEGEGTFERALMLGLREASTPDDPVGRGWIQQMWLNITALGSHAIVILFSVIVVGYLAMLGEWRTAGVFIIGIVGAMFTSTLLKGVFDRPRPDIIPHMVYVGSASFPSGHSLLSAVVYPTLGSLLTRLVTHWRLKIYFLVVAMVLTVLIGVSRVYLGVHYPTDVLAGWMLGLGWGIVCWLALRTLQRRRVVEPPGVPPDARTPGV